MRWFLYAIFLLLTAALLLFILEPAPSFGKFWFTHHAGSLNFTQAIVQRYLYPDIWVNGIVPVLKQAPWYAPTVIAGILAIPYFLIKLLRR